MVGRLTFYKGEFTMYNIENKSNIYYLWNIQTQTESKIGDYNAVVRFIASRYREKLWIDWYYNPVSNAILDSYGCNKNDGDKNYQIYDGLGRTINPRIFEKEAWALYKKGIPEKTYSYRNHKNTGVFRYDPVPRSRKRRGGPSVRPRRLKHLKAMYANPEYKGYNRGSSKDYPLGWWDDWYRKRERNWKSQRKHQWKG